MGTWLAVSKVLLISAKTSEVIVVFFVLVSGLGDTGLNSE